MFGRTDQVGPFLSGDPVVVGVQRCKGRFVHVFESRTLPVGFADDQLYGRCRSCFDAVDCGSDPSRFSLADQQRGKAGFDPDAAQSESGYNASGKIFHLNIFGL